MKNFKLKKFYAAALAVLVALGTFVGFRVDAFSFERPTQKSVESAALPGKLIEIATEEEVIDLEEFEAEAEEESAEESAEDFAEEIATIKTVSPFELNLNSDAADLTLAPPEAEVMQGESLQFVAGGVPEIIGKRPEPPLDYGSPPHSAVLPKTIAGPDYTDPIYVYFNGPWGSPYYGIDENLTPGSFLKCTYVSPYDLAYTSRYLAFKFGYSPAVNAEWDPDNTFFILQAEDIALRFSQGDGWPGLILIDDMSLSLDPPIMITAIEIFSPMPAPVVWSVSGNKSPLTRIAQDGTLTVGNNETAATLTVTVALESDRSVFATALVTVIEKPVELILNPSSASLGQGGSQRFALSGVPETLVPAELDRAIPINGGSPTLQYNGDISIYSLTGHWGSQYNLGVVDGPGASLRFYYDTDNELSEMKDLIVAVSSTGWYDINTPKIQIDWNHDASYFEMTYESLSAHFAETDLSKVQGFGIYFVVNGGNLSNPLTIMKIKVSTFVIDYAPVTWTVSGGSSEYTRISPYGGLIIGAGETASTLTVRAALTHEPGIFAEAAISVAAKTSKYSIGDKVAFGTVPDFSDYEGDGDASSPPGARYAPTVSPGGTHGSAKGMPINWQIVEVVEGGKVILMATEAVASMWGVTNWNCQIGIESDFWKDSNVRPFLNGGDYLFDYEGNGLPYWVPPFTGFTVHHKGGFLGKAFTAAEQSLLLPYAYAGSEDLDGTSDKVAVPSAAEIKNWRRYESINMKAKLVDYSYPYTLNWYTRTPSPTYIDRDMFMVDEVGILSEISYSSIIGGYKENLGVRPVIMLPISYFGGEIFIPEPGEYKDPSNPQVELGFANDFTWDGLALDGSGKMMKDDPRIVIFDDFSDYGGNPDTHIKWSGYGSDPAIPKRWRAIRPSPYLELDPDVKFSGDYSLKLPFPYGNGGELGVSIEIFVDQNAIDGKPMNDEIMTGQNDKTGMDGFALSPGVNPRVGGYEELYARAMMMHQENWPWATGQHNGLSFSGGYGNRPGFAGSLGFMPYDTPHPGGSAGYRSNGYDRFIALVEPESDLLNIYFYGAEQVGATGNRMYPTGTVKPTTGGDNLRPINRIDGENNGFNAKPNFRYSSVAGRWSSVEMYVKLNTVVKEGTSPGPNPYSYNPGDWLNYPEIGPAKIPADCEILRDGEIRVWIDGKLVLEYNDVVFRYTNTMVIDSFCIQGYFNNFVVGTHEPTAVWYDNIVVATEYIGPVNTEPVKLTAAAVSNKANDIKISEDTKNIWTLRFDVNEKYADGTTKVVRKEAIVGKNSDGRIDFGKYYLIYDIKGNGSNIKEFRTVMK